MSGRRFEVSDTWYDSSNKETARQRRARALVMAHSARSEASAADAMKTVRSRSGRVGAELNTILVCAVLATAACHRSEGNNISGPDSQNGRVPLNSVSCGTGTALFSVSPVALGDFFGWVPLGALNPPGHTFPTDHQYLYVNNPESTAPRREVTLYAPSDMYITKGHLGTTNPGAIANYTLEFSPCAEVYGQFGHVLTVLPALLAQIGAIDQFCNTYSPTPGSSVSTCESKIVKIKVNAGDAIGTAGGPSPHSFALDFSLWDARVPAIAYVNPARWMSSSDKLDQFHVVPASEYFAEPVKSQIASRVGMFDGTSRRTASPAGGTIAVDVPGSAMGFWFSPAQPTYPESPHLAVVPDNVNASQVDFSIGTSLASWQRGLVFFTPIASGLVNRNPAQITADGNTYCFESPDAWALLARMMDAGTLRLEGKTGLVTTCAAAQPWTFTAAAFDYKR